MLDHKNATHVRFTFKIDLPFVPAVQEQYAHSVSGTALSPVRSVACTGVTNVAFATKMQNMCVSFV